MPLSQPVAVKLWLKVSVGKNKNLINTSMKNKTNPQNCYGTAARSWVTVISFALVITSTARSADDSVQLIGGAAEAIAAGEKIKSPTISLQTSSTNLTTQLKKDLLALGVTAEGWDTKKERWVSVVNASIPLPSGKATAENVVKRLIELNTIIGINAMTELGQYMGTASAFEVNLSTGGTPVGKLFENFQKRCQVDVVESEKMLKDAITELKQLRAAIMSSSAADEAARNEVDQKIKTMTDSIAILTKEAEGDPAPLTRVNRALDAVMKQIDSSFDPAIASANAEAKAAEMQVKLDALKADRDNALSESGRLARSKILETEKRIAELSAKVAKKTDEAREAFNDYTQTRLSRKTGWASEHVLVGLIPIKYYYGIIPNKGEGAQKGDLVVAVAAAYTWSPATEREIRALLLEDGLGKVEPAGKSGLASYGRTLKRGDLSLDDWIRNQDPLTFGPARFYVDNEGEFHVVASAIEMSGQGAVADRNKIRVMNNANLALLMSLDVQFRDKAVLEMDSVYDATDAEIAAKQESYSASASSKKLLVSSLKASGEDLTIKLSDGSDSREIRYRIIALSAKAIRDSYKIVLEQADTRAQAILASARREGSRQAALDHVKAAEARAPAARAEGYVKGKSDLAPKAPPAAAKSAPASSTTTITVEVTVGPAKKQSVAPVKAGIKKDNTPVPDF